MAAPATTNERAPGDGYLVLWAGSTEIAERDAQVELRRAGVRVETAAPEELVARTNARAPDLVVLGGELGSDPEPLIRELASTSPGAAVPVLALVASERASPRPRSRYGLVARFDRSLEAAALASRISALLSGLSARAPVWRVSARPGNLAPLATRFASSGRSGILAIEGGAIAVEAPGAIAPGELTVPDPGGGGERSLTAYFHERPAGRVRTTASGGADGSLEGARVLVIDDELERRESVTRRLEAAGAQVRATGLVAQAVHASRALDPAVIVIAAPALQSSTLAPVWNEPRLAAASLLVLDGAELESDGLVGAVAAMAEPELALGRRMRDAQALAERLETLGPARWLKLLGPCTHDVTLRVFAAAGRARVDLAGGRIRGASFRPRADGSAVVDGRAAVDALMTLQFGRVLAGPPDALAALEGVSAKRKPSVVGRIEPTPASGIRRNRGLVSKEVVVQHTDRSSPPSTTPAITKRPSETPRRPPAETLPEAESAPAVAIADLAEGNDHETSNYAPETLEALRAELKSKSGSRSDEAPAPPVEVDGAPEPAPEPKEIPSAPVEKPIVTTPLTPVSETPLARPKRRSNAPWFVAAIALALGAGGWAAWRLNAVPSAGPAHSTVPPAASEPQRREPTVEPAAVVGEDATADPPPGEPSPAPAVASAEPERASPEDEPVEADEPAAPPSADPDDLIEQARQAARDGDYARSEVLSRQALELSPRNPKAGYRLAVALFRLDRDREAIAQCETTSRWDPEDPLPLALLGDIHGRRGRFTRAARAYRRALEADPDFAPAQRALERLAARGIE